MTRRDTFENQAEPSGRFAATVGLSLALHLAGFGLAVALPRLIPRGGSGPPVYVVDLVTLPSGGEPGGPAPGGNPPPEKKAIAPPPRPEKPITIPARDGKKKETPRQKPAAARTPEPRPTPARSATPGALDGAAAAPSPGSPAAGTGGPAGGTGTGAGGPGGPGTGGDLASFYFSLLRRRIEGSWQKPIFPPAADASVMILTATVRLTVTSSGRVSGSELVSSSGYEALDRSVLRAVQEAQPFPPFPYALGSDALTVQFAFDLTRD